MDNSKFKKSLLALSITAILSACGSSSDNDGGSSGGDSIEATLNGVAAKGIIIQGNVVADELNADKSVKNANVGSATTDDDGKYSIVLNDTYEGGPIKVTVTAGSDTSVVCDATGGCGTRTDDIADDEVGIIDFGEKYKPGDGNLSMTALLPDAEDGETIEVQITPFTHMAAENALNNTSLDSSIINTANLLVSNLLGGIDILRTEPVDITDTASLIEADASAVVYAALGASIAELAPDDANGQPDIGAALDALTTDFSDGSIDAGDDSEEGSAEDVANISLDEIVQEAGDALAETGSTDTTGVLMDLEGEIEEALGEGGTGVITPDDPENVGDTDIEKAKAFLADLRTWGVTIGGEIDTPSEAFDMQIDMADMASDMVLNDGTGDAIGLGVMAIVDNFNEVIVNLTDFVNVDDETSPFTAGTISSTTTTDGLEYTIADAKVSIDGETIMLDMTVVIPAEGEVTVINLGVKNISSEGDSSKIVVNNGTISATLESAYMLDFDMIDLGTAEEPPALEKIELDLDFTATQKKTVDAAGVLMDASDPVTFAGTLGATLYPYSDMNNEILDVVPGSFSAGGTVSNTSGDSYDMSVSASIPGAATLEPVGDVFALDSTYASNNADDHLVSWAITDADEDGTDDTFTYNHPWNSLSVLFNPDDGSVDITQGGFTSVDPGSYTTLENFITLNLGYLSDYSCCFWVEGQGEYVRWDWSMPDYSDDGFIAFYLDEPDIEFFDAEQPLIGTAGVQFTAQFDGLPEVSVSIEGSATDFEQGNANATIAYGTRMLKFTASNDTEEGDQAGLEITNQDGVKLNLSANNLNDEIADKETADISINGKVVATLEDLDNGSTKVTFIDGTFEIF